MSLELENIINRFLIGIVIPKYMCVRENCAGEYILLNRTVSTANSGSGSDSDAKCLKLCAYISDEDVVVI